MTKFTASLLLVALIGCLLCGDCKSILYMFACGRLRYARMALNFALRYGAVFRGNGKSACYVAAWFIATIYGFSLFFYTTGCSPELSGHLTKFNC